MRHSALWRHEMRRVGWLITAAALVLAVILVLIALNGEQQSSTERMLGAGLEVVLPLLVGIGVVASAGRDPALEIQLTMPTPFAVTMVRRFAVTVIEPVVVAVLAWIVLLGSGLWEPAHGNVGGVLVWLVPVLWLSALGLLLTLVLRSVAAASALIGGLWFTEQLAAGFFAEHSWLRSVFLFPDTWMPGMPGWPINRIVLLGSAAVFLAASCVLLNRPERLLTMEAS